MASTELRPWELRPPAASGALDRTVGQWLVQFEGRCFLVAARWYYWLVDIAPVLLKYEAKQLWRDMKREISYGH
jgi:hypothetical protein